MLSPGPLRPEIADVATASPVGAASSLRDRGVMGLQLHQRGDNAEVRLQWRLGGGVVEARLQDTGRGVEIQLSAPPEQQGLLHRVADLLASQRSEHAFDLEGVEVDTRGSDDHPRRQRRDESKDDAPGVGRRRPGAPRHQLIPSSGVGYCR